MFIETPRFPDSISYGSAAGPTFNTTISARVSGHEDRNQNWTESRTEFEASLAVRNQTQLDDLIEYFQAMAGRTHSFRYKDHSDFKSTGVAGTISDTDQTIGVGDAAEVDFQLIKTYTKGAASTIRTIEKPVAGTVVIALDGTPQGSGFTVDTTTGIVTFDVAPGSSVVVSAGFEFDVPTRFNTDKLAIQLEAFLSGSASVPLIEVRGE